MLALARCRFVNSGGRNFEMRNAAEFAVVTLRNEALEQVRHETRHDLGAELQTYDVIQDPTLRRLAEVLLREKRDGFQSGIFFLDGATMTPSTLRRCIEYMDAQLEGDLRLSELAGEVGISTSHFIRSFRQSTDKTPYQFLLHRRVERAKTVIRDYRTSLTEVALASGFADQHHLARVFRRITGVTPSSYRRSLK
jgi:AraC family transcriptional regulator